MSTLLSVGRVSKLFGSGLYINLYDRFPTKLNLEEPLFVKIDNLEVPLFIDKFDRRGQSSAVVQFADIDTEIRATELLGMELFLREGKADEQWSEADELDDDEIYFEDLVGYEAQLSTEVKGVIEEYIESENPLFRISVGEREVLIPAVEELIVVFDEDRRTIEFSLPDGLLELYLS